METIVKGNEHVIVRVAMCERGVKRGKGRDPNVSRGGCGEETSQRSPPHFSLFIFSSASSPCRCSVSRPCDVKPADVVQLAMVEVMFALERKQLRRVLPKPHLCAKTANRSGA